MSDLTPGRARNADRGPGGTGVVPLRPLTVGELLDSAVAMLRARPRLIVLGFVIAVVEQLALYPLRARADQDISMLPATGHLREYGWLVVAGFATEALVISVLAASAATGSAAALLGRSAPAAPKTRWFVVGTVALLVAALIGLAVRPFVTIVEDLQLLGIVSAWVVASLLWVAPYGLLGLAAPAAAVERRGTFGAVIRSLRLSSRNGLRAAFIRILGYVSWLLVRLGLIAATITIVQAVGGTLPSATWDRVVLAAAAVLVNVVAYPVLGCLDAALLLETRMRTEGLDIALRWAQRRGVTPSLEAPR